MATVTSILSDISSLTPMQIEELYESLTRIIQPSHSQQGSLIGELRETKFKSGFHCRHCGSVDVIRYGKRDGRQRYKCKDCERMSSDLTHTPLYRSKKALQWIRFVECMLKGLSLRKTAELIGVHYVTCFYWRHKLLSALTKEQIQAFQGIIEMDETYFLESVKGRNKVTHRKPRKHGAIATQRGISDEQVCVFVAVDRTKQAYSRVVGTGRILTSQVDECVTPRLSEDSVLCTDAHPSYKKYTKEKSLEHVVLNGSKHEHVKKGIYHLNHINGYHSRLKKWMARFNGVATKYLQLYLDWFLFLDNRKNESELSQKKLMLFLSCLHGTWETYRSLRLRKEVF